MSSLPGKDAGVDQARALDTSEVPDYAGMLRLDGRNVFVAGAGQGIGRQVAHALAQNGANLVCLDYDAEAAEHVAQETGGLGVTSVPTTADVRERGDIEAAFKVATSELGRIDAVVDIVGMAKYVPLLQTSEDDWSWTFDMVLRHAWLIAQVGGDVMRQQDRRDDNGQRGQFAFVGSASGLTGAPFHAAYGAAKAGLLSLVRSIAVEYGPMGMRANAVAPGVVWTPRISAMIGEEGRERNARNSPLRRVAEPTDVASVLLFLLSDLSSYVNGQVISLDGGVSAKFPYPLGE